MTAKATEKQKDTKNKSQLDLAREAGNTWKHDGKEYELFVVNKQGGIAIPIVEGNDVVAISSAVFQWDDKETMLAAVQYEMREETIDDKTKTKGNDAVKLNAELFHNIVQSGSWVDLVDGERQPPIHLPRTEMLDTEEETQSSFIRNWLDNFHIQLHVPKGESRLARLFKKTQDNVFFLCTIGDKDNPAHVLLMEFAKPSLEIRREMRQKRTPEKTVENGKTIVAHPNTSHFRMQQAQKHLVSVQGTSLLEPGNPFDPTVAEHKKTFTANFNPIWMMMLGENLFAAFDNTGK